MSPAFSILIEMENLQQITTGNTAVFQQLSLHESVRSWYLAFFDSWNSSVLSSQDIVNIITYFGYMDHIYIYIWWEVWTCYFLKEMLCEFLCLPSFESSWIRSTGWYLLSCLFLSLPLSWWTSTNLFVNLSLSPTHDYGAICIVLVT